MYKIAELEEISRGKKKYFLSVALFSFFIAGLLLLFFF